MKKYSSLQLHDTKVYLICNNSGGFRGGSRGSLEPPSGPKLFHFHGKFQETFREIRQTNPPFLHLNPHFLNPGSAPATMSCGALHKSCQSCLTRGGHYRTLTFSSNLKPKWWTRGYTIQTPKSHDQDGHHTHMVKTLTTLSSDCTC